MSLERNTSDLNEILEMVEGLGDEEIVENAVYVDEDEKAVYDKDGETNQLDISMLTDKEGLLEQGGETPDGIVYVEGDLLSIENGTTIKNGDTIKFRWSDKEGSFEANGSNGEYFYFGANLGGQHDTFMCGWNTNGYPAGDYDGQHFDIPQTNEGEYSFIYNGNTCTLSGVYDNSNGAFRITTGQPAKAVYEKDGKKKQLDLSMLLDEKGLLAQGFEIIAVDDCDENYEYVRIPLKGHSKCYILPFNRSQSGISIMSDWQGTGYIGKETSIIGVVSGDSTETFSVSYNENTDEILISPIFYQGGSSFVNVLLFD